MHRTILVAFLILSGVLTTLVTMLLAGRWSETEATVPKYIEVDLGDLPPGGNVEHVVELPNPTKSPLTVKTVLVDCSCMSKRIEPRVIAPGGAARLFLTYKVAPLPGPAIRRIDVSFEETAAVTTVAVKGVISKWLIDVPKLVDFGTVIPGASVRQRFAIRTGEPWPEDKRDIQLKLDHTRIESCTEIEGTGHGISVEVVYSPPASQQPGRDAGELVLSWKGMPDRTVRIPCRAERVPTWTSLPDSALFGLLRPGQSREMQIRLRRQEGFSGSTAAELKVSHQLGDALAARLISQGDREAILELKWSSSNSSLGLTEGNVDVIREDGQLVLSIPVTVFTSEQ